MRRMFWISLLVFGLIFSWTLVCAADFYVIPTKKKNYAPVEKTGQTTSYAAGDDGDLEKGVAWPSPRFTANTGGETGTVTDNLTGLMWAQNANAAGTETWAEALTYCNDLSLGGHDDWRLPNVKELQSLIDYGRYSPALPSGHLFSGVQSYRYWSSTTWAYYTGYAWSVSLYSAHGSSDCKTYYYYVWPVRGGN